MGTIRERPRLTLAGSLDPTLLKSSGAFPRSGPGIRGVGASPLNPGVDCADPSSGMRSGHNPELQPQRVGRTFPLPLILFGLAILGTVVWVQSQSRSPQEPLFIEARREIPGYGFTPVALGSQVTQTLATTRLFNGHFFDGHSNRVSVFSADWPRGQGDGGNVFGHTPEICWVGAGFRTVRQGEPSQVFVAVGGRSIPFQCRILKHPDLPTPEITLWAACIDGRWDDIEFGAPPHQGDGSAVVVGYLQEVGRTLSTRWASVRRLVLHPYPSGARKQFVRFSIPLTTEWPGALAALERFAPLWLEVTPKTDPIE